MCSIKDCSYRVTFSYVGRIGIHRKGNWTAVVISLKQLWDYENNVQPVQIPVRTCVRKALRGFAVGWLRLL